MAPLTLDGDTLGQKHRHFNKLVKDAIANKHYKLNEINSDDTDIENLLKIDIASKTRNVDYVIEAMKSNDMLYASKAIKTSRWLITEQEYAKIINPEYLHTQLFPNMNTKAINKLMLQIRLNLKDESRVEAFYEYLKDTDQAHKWLPNCSIPFIENVIQKERHIPLSVFKRLCRRSIKFIPYYKNTPRGEYAAIEEILFLIKSHAADILNIYEEQKYSCPRIGKKKTEILMKTCPQRILDNLEKYIDAIDLSTVAKYINKEEIQSFLEKQFKNENLVHFFRDYTNLKHFIKNMPEQKRIEFIKKTFIDTPTKASYDEEFCYKGEIHCITDSYQWYEYVPFNITFAELRKLIRAESSPSERCSLLSVLIASARRNPEHIKTLLKFFYEKHINEPFKFKIQFVNNLLKQVSTHEIDVETWSILDQLFHSMEVYTLSENNVQLCLKTIILYKVLHDENVPEIVENKIKFDTFKKIQKKLSKEQKDKMFSYLLNLTTTKIQNKKIANESDFNETVNQLKDALQLLQDWKKDIIDYPFILNKIQELIKTENSWKTELSVLYNTEKSWRKHMFDESLVLSLSEESCLNALKHNPQLLTRHDKEIETLRTNDAVSLRRLLAKLRVYWPHSLAQHWTDAYLHNLNKPTSQKALIKGLVMLLPQKELIDMAQKHVPKDFKINWGATDQTEITIRKNIAQYLHLARPLAPLDIVLWYAKGDYLQYAVPSLNAILHNLSKVQSQEYLPKLLEAPVSLQKIGLHLAFGTLKSNELKPILLQIWSSTKNSTIRSVLFIETYTLMCKMNSPTAVKELWESLSMFIDNLSAEENKDIYKKLGNVKNVPVDIQSEFYMKSYEFLTSLPERANCEKYVNELIRYAPNIIAVLDEEFVADKILSPADTKFCKFRSDFIELFAFYVLFGKSDENQLQRFKRVLKPAMELAFLSWNSVHKGQYYIKDNFTKLLSTFNANIRKYITLNNVKLSAKLFIEINQNIEEKMPLHENYVQYTCWKLVTEYVKLMEEHKSLLKTFESHKFSDSCTRGECVLGVPNDIEKAWEEIHIELSPKLSSIIVKCLKEDAEQYFPTIYSMFSDALDTMFLELSFTQYKFRLQILKHMLNDHDFIPSFLVVCKSIPKYHFVNAKEELLELRKIIASHPSKEVQMHYHHSFGSIPEENI